MFVFPAVIVAVAAASAEAPQAEARSEHGSVFVGLGAERGAVYHDLSFSAHGAVHFGATSGPSAMVTLTIGNYESSLVLSAGYRFGLQLDRWRLYLGPEAGFGFMGWADTGGPLIQLGPYLGVSLEAYPRAFLSFEGHFPVRFPLSRYNDGEGKLHIALFQPGGWLGFTWAF